MEEEKEIKMSENVEREVQEEPLSQETKEEALECLNCGAKLQAEQEFCTKCGMKKGKKKK